MLLKPKESSGGLLKRFFGWFNRSFTSVTNGYVRVCGALIRKSAIALILLVVFAAGAGFFGSKVPSSFLPDEDQGYLYINLQLPNAASLQRTNEVASKIEEALAKTPWRPIHNQRYRLQFAEFRSDQLQRILFRHVETVG